MGHQAIASATFDSLGSMPICSAAGDRIRLNADLGVGAAPWERGPTRPRVSTMEYRRGRYVFDTISEQIHALPVAIKGRRFERLVAWYLRTAPEYRNVARRVYLWDEWPGRWGADAGIDLVVETQAGDTWAVQAKAYRASYSIKKADIDSFLSESSRREFSFRLLVATTDRVGARAARTIHEQEKPVGLKLLSQLRHEALEWPESLEALDPPPAPRLAPRRQQLAAISAVVDGLRGADRGQLLMACGTGKTLTSLWIDEAIGNRRTLVIVPSLSLLGQTLRTWTANAAEPFDYLAVCSDETVADSDSFTSWTADLGIPVTTDAATIRTFLAKRAGRRVVFSTYHSVPVVAEAQLGRPRVFDLVVVDEAHRAAGRADSSFGTVLDERRLRARKRLFMTATPRFVSRQIRTAASELDVELTSMDDTAIFGPVLHQLSFRDAIDRGLLSDYRVVVIGVDDPGVGRAVDRRELVTVNDHLVMDAEALARQLGLLLAVRRFGLKRILTFHSRKATARQFAVTLPQVLDWMPSDARPRGRPWARHITGDMTAGEREVLLDALRALDGVDWGVLSNVRCVAEGVDVPTLDGVVFVDPRRSEIEVIQAVGRAIRKSPNKSLGIIVIPVFIPRQAEDEDVLASSDFRKVWSVVRALRAHDEVLAERLDAARFELGRRGGMVELPHKIVLDLPRSVSPDFARALSARLVQRTTEAFPFWIGLLSRYADEHGTAASLETRTCMDGYRLGSWAVGQRQLYDRGRMTPEHAARLESIPGWVWRIKAQHPWGFWFDLLARYVDEHKTLAGLKNTTVLDGHKLGEWAADQRRRRALGPLSETRAAQLEGLPDGFGIDTRRSGTRCSPCCSNTSPARGTRQSRTPTSKATNGSGGGSPTSE